MNTRLASNVHPSEINSSFPMLDVPGCADSASDPKAVPVVSAENRMRGRWRCPAVVAVQPASS